MYLQAKEENYDVGRKEQEVKKECKGRRLSRTLANARSTKRGGKMVAARELEDQFLLNEKNKVCGTLGTPSRS